MNFPIPSIVDCTLSHAIASGCDSVMLKHDGYPVTINCAAGACNVFSDFGQTRDLVITTQLIEPLDALFIGAKSRFHPTIHLYDCWWINGQDIQHASYRERYVLTRMNARKLGDERFVCVQTHPLSSAEFLWAQVVADPVSYKGLVFRRSRDTAAGDLYVRRYYVEAPTSLDGETAQVVPLVTSASPDPVPTRLSSPPA